ncbi:MAG: T9SS type A sorting domain-containing protein [Crocinitomicaceae bacterium]|nr:T9SS type A sorting domain-containing protein [Crocinitomicaceae bacterium]
MTVTPSTCLGATGSATAEINGFGSPFEVYWSTGYSTSTGGSTSISNLSSGVYYVNVTDIHGCKNVAKANISDSDISVSPTLTDVRCAGQPGSIDLTIIPSSGTVDEILWSNGSTAPIIAAGPGEYSVSIHTTANCNFFGTYSILDSALKVKLDDYYPNSNCLSAPNGEFYITTTGGLGAYAWDWKKSGTTVWTQEDLLTADGGLYTCTVSDGNGCSLTWAKTLENYNNVNLWADETVQPTCGNSDGSIDITIDGLYDTPSFYEWSNGATTEDLSGLAAGNYTLTYTDQAGCTNYLTIKLVNQRPYQPTICLLTVDTSLIYNMVVWEKDITQPVSAFNIYRETSVFGQFEKIVTRPYALESFFQDNDASPVDRSWRYYITTVDACGTESYGSFVHKTIHIVSSTSDGTNYTISWDDYEGISYSSIDLFRHDDVNGWELAANLPYGTNFYNEAPLVLAGLDYMVSFNLTNDCTSSKAQDHNSTRSNKTASSFDGGGSTAEIQDEDLGLISIYPNPANEMLTLHIDNPELFQTYEITDLNGRVIASGTILTNNTNIDLYSMESGVYMIRLISDDKTVVNKFVKN